VLFNTTFILVSLFVQWRIAAAALRWIGRRFFGLWRTAARGALFLFEALLAAGYACTFSDPVSRLGIPGHFAMVMGACSLAYLAISAGVLAVYLVFRRLGKHVVCDVDPGRRQALQTMSNVLMATPFVAMGYGIVQRTDFHVRELDVPIPGLAKDLDGLRILQLSDIHLSAFLSEAELARVIDASLGLRPHLAVVTGDLISQRGDPLDACIRQLARVKADAGVFGCMGNHERYARAEDYTERAAARVGIRFLRGACRQLRFGGAVLNLAGVDHQSKAGGKPYLPGAEQLVAPGACNVLLSHNPDVFPVAAAQGYHFMLSGHTHGGQVTVEILDQSINPARFFTPFVYGLYHAGAAAAYVTRGIGTIGIPARIGAPPEISVLRLRKA
jgi:predicted MPP superfamily phosphohydrolase